MVITETNTVSRNGYTDVLAYGSLGSHPARLNIHIDGFYAGQSYAKVALWTSGSGWQELVRLMPGQIKELSSRGDDNGVEAITKRLQLLAEHVKPV